MRDTLAVFGGLCAVIGLAVIVALAAYGTVHLMRGSDCLTTSPAEQPWRGDRPTPKRTPKPTPSQPDTTR